MAHTAVIHEVGVVVGEQGMGSPVVILEAREKLVPIVVSQDQHTRSPSHSEMNPLNGR